MVQPITCLAACWDALALPAAPCWELRAGRGCPWHSICHLRPETTWQGRTTWSSQRHSFPGACPLLTCTTGLARLFPTQNTVSHSHRLLCFSTGPAASPHFPAHYPGGFIHLAQWGCCEHGPATQCPASASPTQQNMAAVALNSVQSDKKWEETFFTWVTRPSYSNHRGFEKSVSKEIYLPFSEIFTDRSPRACRQSQKVLPIPPTLA